MSEIPRHKVYEVVRDDWMHMAGHAPGWYFEIPDVPDDGVLKGPYRTEAIARRVCTRWLNDYEKWARRLSSIFGSPQ